MVTRGNRVAPLVSFLHALSWVGEMALSVVSGFVLAGKGIALCTMESLLFMLFTCLNTRGEFSGVLGRWRIREGRVGEKHNGWNQAADKAGQQS